MHLALEYRPSAGQWSDIYTLDRSVPFAHRVRAVHRGVSQVAVFTAVAVAALGLAAAIEERRRRRLIPLAIALAIVIVGGSFTGHLLPWDQLALWAVTVGTDVRGFRFLTDSEEIRFVIIGGSEVSVATLATWFWVHVALLPVVAIGLGVATLRALGRRPARVAAEERE